MTAQRRQVLLHELVVGDAVGALEVVRRLYGGDDLRGRGVLCGDDGRIGGLLRRIEGGLGVLPGRVNGGGERRERGAGVEADFDGLIFGCGKRGAGRDAGAGMNFGGGERGFGAVGFGLRLRRVGLFGMRGAGRRRRWF